MILQNHRRLPVYIFRVKIAALGSLKREGFSKLVSNFKGASINFEFYSFINKETKNRGEFVEIVNTYLKIGNQF
jgi:hypothetical protein